MVQALTKLAQVAQKAAKPARHAATTAPAIPPAIEQVFVPGEGDELVYHPRLLAAAELVFNSTRYDIHGERNRVYTVEFDEGPVSIDWDNSETVDLHWDDLADEPESGAGFADCPDVAQAPGNYAKWGRDFKRWLRQAETITLYRNKRFRLTSTVGETEGDFRARLQIAANEKRDQAVAKLRKRYATKTTTLENRLLRAQQAIDREKQQATRKKLDTAVSFGTAILGTLLGRKRLSTSSATRIGSAIKTAGGARKEAADIKRAEETAAKVQADIEALNRDLEREVAALDTTFDAQSEELDEIVIRAKSTDIHVAFVGLAWMPYRADEKGRLYPAWT